MSELKTYKMIDEKYCADCVCVIPSEVYLKSEADKVIADLEESHKMEVEQLLMEIVRLKEHNENYRFDNKNMLRKITKQDVELRHNKFKRCLAMAWWCSAELGMLVSTWEFKIKHYKKWQRRWLTLAEKFKEGK